MRDIEIDGELCEVSEEDYQRFLDDQREAQEYRLVQAIVNAISGANDGVSASVAEGNKAIVGAVKELRTQIKALAVPPINVPPIEIPEMELVMPPQRLIKGFTLKITKRNSRDLITECAVEVQY